MSKLHSASGHTVGLQITRAHSETLIMARQNKSRGRDEMPTANERKQDRKEGKCVSDDGGCITSCVTEGGKKKIIGLEISTTQRQQSDV